MSHKYCDSSIKRKQCSIMRNKVGKFNSFYHPDYPPLYSSVPVRKLLLGDDDLLFLLLLLYTFHRMSRASRESPADAAGSISSIAKAANSSDSSVSLVSLYNSASISTGPPS